MLPVLKEAGVVDSGGQGLLEVLRGAIDGFLGKEVDYSEFEKPAGAAVTKISPQAEADIKFGYCTEFIILLNKPMPIEEEHSFKEFLLLLSVILSFLLQMMKLSKSMYTQTIRDRQSNVL